jgi:hypothetical protein
VSLANFHQKKSWFILQLSPKVAWVSVYLLISGFHFSHANLKTIDHTTTVSRLKIMIYDDKFIIYDEKKYNFIANFTHLVKDIDLGLSTTPFAIRNNGR